MQAKQWGVTEPLSVVGADEADVQRDATLDVQLHEYKLYNSDAEARKQEMIIGMLHSISMSAIAMRSRR